MAYFEHHPRVGRSQGVLLFWGLVSVVFAALFCFYFWKNHENEATANKLRDEVLTLQDQVEALSAEKSKLQTGISDNESQLKEREDALQDKETKLADEETRLNSLAKPTSATTTQGNSTQAAALATASKKIDDLSHKLTAAQGADVITRGNRPVLRVPGAVFFAPGDATLKPDGKTFLNQLAQSINGQMDTLELRMESFTDTDPEAPKSAYANSWDLTAARAATVARYLRDQTPLPFQNVAVIARGDSSPVVTGAKDDHTRNSRFEISLLPLPPAAHAADAAHTAATTAKPPVNPLTPPPDPPPANKPK